MPRVDSLEAGARRRDTHARNRPPALRQSSHSEGLARQPCLPPASLGWCERKTSDRTTRRTWERVTPHPTLRPEREPAPDTADTLTGQVRDGQQEQRPPRSSRPAADCEPHQRRQHVPEVEALSCTRQRQQSPPAVPTVPASPSAACPATAPNSEKRSRGNVTQWGDGFPWSDYPRRAPARASRPTHGTPQIQDYATPQHSRRDPSRSQERPPARTKTRVPGGVPKSVVMPDPGRERPRRRAHDGGSGLSVRRSRVLPAPVPSRRPAGARLRGCGPAVGTRS